MGVVYVSYSVISSSVPYITPVVGSLIRSLIGNIPVQHKQQATLLGLRVPYKYGLLMH